MPNWSRFSFRGLARSTALAVLAIAALSSAAYAQNTVGTVTRIQGIANVQRGASTLAVVPHLPIMLHDRIVTETDASMTITMVDNSSLQLGGGATLTIDESVLVNGVGAPSKVGLFGGSVHSLIAGAMKGSTTTFQIHTPNAVGAVRGTEWDTTYSEGTPRDKYPDCTQFTDVAVQDGTVNISSLQDPNQNEDVHKGKKSTVACGALVSGGTSGAGGIGGLGAGATAAGVGAAAVGAGVGGAAAAGAFDSSNPKKPKKHTPKG
ncbi:MAG TPA: FecR family protein [Candidatus Acidoferrales bacterium]|nr:FecR family protein [Candidatus Acidoferrales bacterium]